MTGGAEGQTPTSYAITFQVAAPTLMRPASAYEDEHGVPLALSAIIAREEQSAAEHVRWLLSTGEATLHIDVAPVYGEVINNHADFESSC